MQPFPCGPRDRVRLDPQERVRAVIHGDAVPEVASDPVGAAVHYLVVRAAPFGLSQPELDTLAGPCPAAYNPGEPLRLHLERVSAHPHGTTVAFISARHGLPCTRGGVVVQLHAAGGPGSLVAAAARVPPPHTGPLPTPAQVAAALADPAGLIEQALTPVPAYLPEAPFTLLGHRLAVAPPPPGSPHAEVVLDATIRAQSVPLDGRVLRVQVAVRTGQLWSLELSSCGVKGTVFPFDALSATGVTGLSTGSSDSLLDGATDPARDLNLTLAISPAKQVLSGPQVTTYHAGSDPAPPEHPVGTDFDSTPRTSDFGWVSAHYHVDHAISRLGALGLDQPTLFARQPLTINCWPLPVRIEKAGGSAYASAKANTSSGYDGAAFVSFVPLDTTGGATLYASADGRIAWHELCGHVTLLNHLDSGNLRFAHSFGDGLGAIYAHALTGYDTAGYTFPWSKAVLTRRHDREPASGGWGWGSATVATPVDYDSEQRLSSTLYRLYRSLGGDSGSSSGRLLAAEIAAWLTVGSIPGLTQASSPPTADDFEARMEVIDALAWPAKGWSGGAYHKVVRWAFEKQGCFQIPDSTDLNKVGSPPATDVFVQDGRNGEYTYSAGWWWKGKVWNRLAADGVQAHQKPVAGQTNYIYARVGNRGSTKATGVALRGWYGPLVIGAEYPTDFTAIPSLSAGFSVNAGELSGVVSAPIPWTPPQSKNYALLVAAQHASDGDNTPSFGASKTVALSRLVPHDNNLGVRLPWIVMLVPMGTFFKFSELLTLSFRPALDGRLELRFSLKAPGSSKFSAARARAIGLDTRSLPVARGQCVNLVVDPPPFPRPSWMTGPCQLMVAAYLDGALAGGTVGLLQP